MTLPRDRPRARSEEETRGVTLTRAEAMARASTITEERLRALATVFDPERYADEAQALIEDLRADLKAQGEQITALAQEKAVTEVEPGLFVANQSTSIFTGRNRLASVWQQRAKTLEAQVAALTVERERLTKENQELHARVDKWGRPVADLPRRSDGGAP